MQKNSNAMRANRLLYMIVVAVLCLTALIIGITAALNRSGEKKKPSDTTPSTTAPISVTSPITTPAPVNPEQPVPETPPTLIAPTAGAVTAVHDLTVPVFSDTMQDWRVHRGIDISAAVGAPVCAAADGTVQRVWRDPMMGYSVSVTHTGGMTTIYQNLSENYAEGIAVGAAVKAGDALGTIGDSSISELAEEPHLHFIVELDGKCVDPLSYISEESRAASLVADTAYES